MAEAATTSKGIGFFGLLFIVFLVLKLTEVINWSWWWITAPLWGPAASVMGGFIVFFLGAFLVAAIAASIETLIDWYREKRG